MSYAGIRDRTTYDETVRRIGDFSEKSVRKWGKMEHSQVLPHLADGMRLTLKGFTTPPSGPFRFAPLRYLVLHVGKWPEGKVEAPPGAFETDSAGLESDCGALCALLEEYLNSDPNMLSKQHPAFGNMKTKDWDVLVARHMDHHLRQFSC